MDFERMYARVQCHLEAWASQDPARALALCTDDLAQEVIGWPLGGRQGGEAARALWCALARDFRPEGEPRPRVYYLPQALVLDEQLSGCARGLALGPGAVGRSLRFRVLHVFEFREESLEPLICRATLWIDGEALQRQLQAAPARGALPVWEAHGASTPG